MLVLLTEEFKWINPLAELPYWFALSFAIVLLAAGEKNDAKKLLTETLVFFQQHPSVAGQLCNSILHFIFVEFIDQAHE